MGLQLGADFVHAGLRLVVFGFHRRNFIGRFFKQAEKTALGFFLGRKGPQFGHQIGHHLPDLAHVLGAYAFEGGFRKAGDLLLGCRAVGENHVAVGHIDGLGKVLHHLFFLGRQIILAQILGNFLRLGRQLRHHRRLSGHGIQRQHRGRIRGGKIHQFVSHILHQTFLFS